MSDCNMNAAIMTNRMRIWRTRRDEYDYDDEVEIVR